jgi:hypothetical protein
LSTRSWSGAMTTDVDELGGEASWYTGTATPPKHCAASCGNRAAGGCRRSPPIYHCGESRGRRAPARNRAPRGNIRPGKSLPDAAVLFTHAGRPSLPRRAATAAATSHG